MDYMILDSAGNALASFQDEETAHATLYAMSQVEPLAAEDVALIAYGDDGLPVGEAMFIADAPLPVTFEDSVFVLRGVRTCTGARRRSPVEYVGNWNWTRVQDPQPV